MASNNPSSSRVAHRSGPPSPPALGKAQSPAYDSDGLESDDDTLLALSSLARMETYCAPHQNEAGASQQEKAILSSNAVFESSTDSIDVVQQAIDAVENALARCPKYERREALTELLMHAKLEQAKKATVYSSDCLQHANIWAAMLMQVQELGRNYPKDPQVHQLVHLIQQCVTRGGKHEPEQSHNAKEEETRQQELADETELCGRLGEATVDVDVSEEEGEDSIGYRITEDIIGVVSNQAEEDRDEAGITQHNERDTDSHRDEAEIEDVDKTFHEEIQSVASPPSTRLRELLPILTGNVVLKGVQVPQLPRGSDGYSSSDSDKTSSSTSKSSSKSVGKNSRQKFKFPEKELLQLLEDEEVNPPAPSPGLLRRFSQNSKITCTVPLRRKSFSMKRSPLKSSPFVGFAPRRNSRSFSATKQQILAFNSRRKSTSFTTRPPTASPRSSSPSSPPSPVPSTHTQMVLRVRERSSDGVPELVIAKKPVRFVVWHWNDRCVRVPFMSAANFMELGPAQHGIMLRQLRYVKSMMHELPWAKAHLRSLLSKYTAKEVTKEELYPQLNALGQQVQHEISSRAKQHRLLTARKQRLTVTLTLATSVVNDTLVTKFGRRGRPHASRLLYDPTTPLQLRWRRKHGERSVESLIADEIEVIEAPDISRLSGGAGTFGRGNKKAAAAVAVDPESCLSLVTPTRSLDLQVASALHREWLANAVRDIVVFAKQYKAAKSHGATLSDDGNSSDSIPSSTAIRRRSRQSSSMGSAQLY
ncbi:uncharacterized protein PITG_15655 [Phytophthora infestans T30-4]|uniref:Uncharacterized protein n=1 Tax=Phytophthora infestans (strain T30-4) TaxID=403677 RepID=D0NS91_PHYIT|nr:uncharacterized protein PITG_15655 [Phytophthora infestans T30-4]EEY64436.1 conserved hypothetical protein [Phytophthora infestans T30-4]|eukprot:XP_002897939.1 conserved hypothetical protein [Phytophthora infestans T30-4]